MSTYCYSTTDYIHYVDSWGTVSQRNRALSKFDKSLLSKWDGLMERGQFKYSLDHVKHRLLPGKEGFVVILNTKRGALRRIPEVMETMDAPFDPAKFNFTKVKEEEALYELCPQGEYTSNSPDFHGMDKNRHDCMFNNHVEVTERHVLLINISPITRGNSLLVCNADGQTPQKMTVKAMKMATEMLLLSNNPGLRLGFNSLCAYSSVNHQHIHVWYMETHLAVETASVQKLCDGLYEMIGKPTRALVLQLHGSSVEETALKVFKITDFFQRNNIAHNVLLTRGSIIGALEEHSGYTVRIYIWPRKSAFGMKIESKDTVCNVGVYELSGCISVFDPDGFEHITEEDIIKFFKAILLPDEEFDYLKNQVISLINSS